MSRRWPVLALAAGVAALTLMATPRQEKRPPAAVTVKPTPTPAPRAAAVATAPTATAPSWKEVDRLVSEQKFEEASRVIDALLQSAKTRKDSAEWTRALIRAVQVRTGLHGYETAVRFLKDEPWPSDLLSRAALELFYAQSLVNYARMYSWEISQRERVESAGKVDLKAWTREQIYDEAVRSYVALWKEREALGRQNVKALAEYVEPNDYPPGIRPTLRDALSYFFTDLLADSSGWSPAQSNAVYALDLAGLLRADAKSTAAIRLDDPGIHPVERYVAVLADLEGWHAGRDEREAAFEARLERLRRLPQAFTEPDDRNAIEKDLAGRLPKMAELPWFAMGQAQLAELREQDDRPDALVRARAAAEEGRRAYPDSIGGRRCRAIVARIEAPSYELETMRIDGPRKRSVLVTHKNVGRLTFRAYPIDLPGRLASLRDMNRLLPQPQEIERLVSSRTPAAEWTAELPATPDYRPHRTYVVPPLSKKGLYVVAASAATPFGGKDFPVSAASFLLSDLVLVKSQSREAGNATRFDVRALSGETGRPVAQATVDLLRGEWSPERIERVDTATTDTRGFAELRIDEDPHRGRRFLYARKGDDLALDLDPSYWTPPERPERTTASLAFTDRAIYRPSQKILWKVLAYQGDPREGRFAVSPRSAVSVSLYDRNNQVVETRSVTSNDFGTASGEFLIPSGRALGVWRVATSLGGMDARINVEEYKRPTFEVTLKDPAEPLRLNRPARLTGEARYYFGLPVASGNVRWKVTRTPQFPWWFWWRGWGRAGGVQTETIAAGTSALQADGTFTLAFTPAADERLAGDRKGVTYSYTVAADASDEGGETRSASRAFRLGFVAVEARVDLPGGFLRAGSKSEITVVRTNLDGVGRAGRGSWRIVRLEQPAAAALPAELPPDAPMPVEGRGEVGALRTPGDGLRPRWDTAYDPSRVMAGWKDGAEVARGDAAHDEKGIAKIALAGLSPGAYRLLYSTRDEFGAEYEAPREFVVAGEKTPLALAGILLAESGSVPVGQTARLFAASGLAGQPITLEIDRDGRPVERRDLTAGSSAEVIEIPIQEKHRGGFGVKLTVLRDFQLVVLSQTIFVPWDDRELEVSFATFRDRIRPGERETWTVKVAGPKGARLENAAAEILAYMYDRSLDSFVPYDPANALALYPNRTAIAWSQATLGVNHFQHVIGSFPTLPDYPSLRPDELKLYGGYAMGGPGRRGVYAMAKAGAASDLAAAMPASAPAPQERERKEEAGDKRQNAAEAVAGAEPAATLRSNFSETAFWKPNLLTGPDGSASIEFTVPDSVTSWNVWVQAVTKDLKAGSLRKETKSVKELMVRPYVPRFLREGDLAELKVVVNNASEKGMSGKVALDILDTTTNASVLADFGLSPEKASMPFSAAAGAGADVTFRLATPKRVGSYAIKATAASGSFSDGELRPVPVLPGRMQLAQSRFAALRGGERRTLVFEDMARPDDPSRVDEQLVVTIDGQLFYSVLSALPYLVNYPYECTEQTLNRFLSTGIVSSVFKDYPAVAAMAQELSKRDTQLEPWAGDDPNRRMALEETPWLEEARGGDGKTGPDLTRVLDPKIAKADRDTAIAKLRKAQTESGGFPWWPGGPPSPYMTLYILNGFAHALEFGVEVPKDMVERAFRYAGADLKRDLDDCMAHKGVCEFVTYVNYVLSSYPDESWYAGAFDAAYRKKLLDYSFQHWKEHSPYLKGQLTLTLRRMARPKDAKLVWDSVMDAAKTDPDLGTYFAPEDRAWLWYNDTIETQAFALRVLAELDPADSRRHGLVQWLFLNKKMNQWKSTRATAEVIYALVWYLRKEGALAVREDVTVDVASQKTTFVFEPDRYTGKRNQVLVPGEKIDPKRDSRIGVEKTGKGLAFASATWHFSTEKLPEEDRGDFFSVSRKYFLRESTPSGMLLKPLAEGTVVRAGDEIEVQISLRTKHAAEYVHLRDPRPAGAEPQNVLSRYKWDLGIAWYEETRDSGSNFFFEWLPVGEYTFKHRIRANMAGTFKVSPATVQSMYAPEFHAYSAGATLRFSP